MRTVVKPLGLLGLTCLALFLGLRIGHSGWKPPLPGIPDAGLLVSRVLQGSNLIGTILGVRILGLTISATFFNSSNDGIISRYTRERLLHACRLSALWALVNVTIALSTLATVLGLPIRELFGKNLIATYMWALPPSRAYLISGIIAIGLALLGILAVSLNTTFAMVLLAMVAIATPLLNSHQASFGDHSLALTSSVIHGLAIATWLGTLWAIIPFFRDHELQVVHRYSAFALVTVGAVLMSGVGASYARLKNVADLWASDYGHLVIIKVLIFSVLLALAWQARKRLDTKRTLWSVVRIEIVLMACALGFGLALKVTPPSRNTGNFNSAAEEILGFSFPEPPTIKSLLLGWQPDWFVLIFCVIAVFLYLRGAIRVSANQVPWAIGRTISFVFGIMCVIWSTSGGISRYAMISFSAHMISHMVLSMLAPVLITLGAPVTLALRALPASHDKSLRNARAWILSLLHSKFVRFTTNPIFVLLIFTVGLYGLYFTSIFATLMASHTGHVFMSVHFLISGLLFAYLVIGVDPAPRKIPYWSRLLLVLVALSIHAFFGLAIMQSQEPLGNAWYSTVTPPWLIDSLHDTQVAGGFAWAFGEIPMLVLLVVISIQWSRSDERLARQKDRAADRDGNQELDEYNQRLLDLHNRQ